MTNKATQESIYIRCQPRYLADESSPIDEEYTFAYTITVLNRGEQTVQLISRRWTITDEDLAVQEVAGEGVVGRQPTLEPGQGFEYTSRCRLRTPRGQMQGEYLFVSNAETFTVPIPMFKLDASARPGH